MKLTVPELSLVVLIGPSGCGKSTFARKHFKATEVLSSDVCRGLVSDDENDQSATNDAFEVLHFIARKRLAAGKLTVVDATNVQSEARKPLVKLAREFHCLPVAIVLDVSEKVCHERNQQRPDRNFGPHVIRQQVSQLRRSMKALKREGFRHVYKLSSQEEIDEAAIERQPLWNNRKHEHGPFDIIGDVHGCFDELVELLTKLGYRRAVAQASSLSSQNDAPNESDGNSEAAIAEKTGRMPVLPASTFAMETTDKPVLPFVSFDRNSPVSFSRRNLPHWKQDGATYFVTFRLADSVPAEKLEEWKQQREQWLKDNPKPWSDEQSLEYHQQFNDRFEQWLDNGHGSCVLRSPEAGKVVEEALRHFDGERYLLGTFVVMPNHVHALVRPVMGHQLSDIFHSWKSFTANAINKLLNRSGQLWQDESFDHIVRDETAVDRFARYIQENPVNARLQPHEYRFGCGTAGIAVAQASSLLFEEREVDSDVGETAVAETGRMPVLPGAWRHPEGRKLVFVGDLVDRGPKSPEVVRLVMDSVSAGVAFCVPGNHDVKFMRAVRGKKVQITHGLGESLEQFEKYEQDHPGFTQLAADFIDSLVSHYVFDDGKLVVAHAGMKEEMQGRGSGAVREFALYGETTGETDEFGLPVRYNWAAEYRGRAMVVYGHTPVPEPEWLNRTIDIDTGCVYGGKLTALRYPEKELVSVLAKAVYAESKKPFLAAQASSLSSDAPDDTGNVTGRMPVLPTSQQQNDDVLDIADVIGKRIISTRLQHNVTIREENAIAALEVMSWFAANPKWLIYLPPTMSPCETSKEPGLLEHPAEAFAYFRQQGVPRVVCEEKHMGSRAVVIVCRDEVAARKRFGVADERIGIVYTRTGRRFFDDAKLETEFLKTVCNAMSESGLWDDLETDWICLDCELMPWSAKAQSLIRDQYAAVGAAAKHALFESVATLQPANATGVDVGELLESYQKRQDMADKYVAAYQQYCWPVKSINDFKLAPFHILATEGKVYADKDHAWHMEMLTKLCASSEALLLATLFKVIDVTDTDSQREGIEWWNELTGRGGEGMVVKPLDFIVKGRRGLMQPAVKCRGPEYLRIIYGPEYSAPENLERLRSRSLGRKRSLALREFALGIESLERFVRGEPLRRVHECVFGVLALESEPVDPRL